MALHHGDLVTLHTTWPTGRFLACDGLVSNACFTVPGTNDSRPDGFRRCVFRVAVPRQYHALEELKMAMARGKGKVSATQMQTYREAVEAELAMNEKDERLRPVAA